MGRWQSCLQRLAGLLVWGLLLAGCAALDTPSLPSQSLLLDDVPFHPQQEFQCGPAALLSLLEHSGVNATYSELVDRVYIPKLQGSLQLELIAAARRYDRLPYVLEADAEQLIQWLQQGYPVLVLQNLGIARIPVWHFAVLLGYDSADDVVLLHSGERAQMRQDWRRFLRSWQRGGLWAAVLLSPDQLPPMIALQEWLSLGAAFDEQASVSARLNLWRSLAQRWPEEALVSLGLGNAHYAAGDLRAAADTFAQALAQGQEAPALRMNLAAVQLELIQPCAAYETLSAQAAPALEHPLAADYRALLAQATAACAPP